MELKCEYCGAYLSDTDEKCPNCGAINRFHKRAADNTPQTIEDLKKWYEDRHLPPYETTRFFIGIDYKEPKAFGIYEENGNYIVYKNKADGSRAVRYQGRDQAYAVNEIYLKLKSEILNQKANQGNRNRSGGGTRSRGKKKEEMSMTEAVFSLLLMVFGVCSFGSLAILSPMYIALTVILVGIPFGLFYYLNGRYKKKNHRDIKLYWPITLVLCIYTAAIIIFFAGLTDRDRTPTYYRYDDTVYCYYDHDYYIYDDDDFDYSPINKDALPVEIVNNGPDYEYNADDIEWDSDYSFTDSDYYEDNIRSSSSSSDSSYSSDSDSSYDWDSGSDWDSGGSDWDSDW